MGRSRSSIAFRKFDPSFESFLPWPPEDCPISWEKVFGRRAPLSIEIGFGRGEFLARQAQLRPERDFVGFELTWGAIHAALHEIASRKLANVRVMRCDGRVALDWLFSPKSIQEIVCLFPIPWPSERKAKHRLFQSSLLHLANNRLEEGGVIHIVTDRQEFSDWILERIEATGFRAQQQRINPELNTHYERKWMSQGQNKFTQLKLEKQTHPDWPKKERRFMKSFAVPHWDPKQFHPQDERGEAVIGFKEFLYDAQRERGMLRVVVVEENLVQEFWVDFSRAGASWMIRPARGCPVLPTQAVGRAMELLAKQMKPALAPSSI
ncbi:MAG: tRNA (guanosine(46)-N7)-methyltransferase TrmB [Candidatus Omnitrophica bacterium]|nr:tRNA (guanosine(46)-N7)-methyltransferase TrmB [Candidatus Omnitrophota bacterium]